MKDFELNALKQMAIIFLKSVQGVATYFKEKPHSQHLY